MALHALPDELLIWVLRQLESPIDLSNVALCSRRLHNLVLPILYLSFKDDGALLKTPRFLATTVRRPEIARYVKKLSINGHNFRFFPPGTFDKNWDRIEAVLKPLCRKEETLRDWYHDLHHSADAIIALAILLFPNVSIFTLPYYSSLRDVKYTPLVLSQTSRSRSSDLSTLSPLYQLRTLTFDKSYRGVLFVEYVQPFLSLGSLRSVSISDVWMIERDPASKGSIGRPTSHITHLSLHRSSINTQALLLLLNGCPNLTHLSYCHSNINEEGDGFYNPFNTFQIHKTLMCLKRSLHVLNLLNLDEEIDNSNTEIYYPIREQGASLPLGSLADFEQLHTLQTTSRIILGGDGMPFRREPENRLSTEERALRITDGLPKELETLVLYRCTESIYSVMTKVFERKEKGALKKLKKVTLMFRNSVALSLDGASCIEQGLKVGIVVKCGDVALDQRRLPTWSP
ncbi:hypothetical protein L207DRAFT_514637 [Hyaloscypha variabilis F]|uniref:F-box domain-containing protein n=1 Tax=Hyaloscypha variabilis (strain UAMH 11265 / GT02V1 / F) TaxID=1149755 RepID=A0A2J6RFR1_HYAVF|nr:hypothetical protein L207DRAFT_514637 [Hyaloscypha variabilis F]